MEKFAEAGSFQEKTMGSGVVDLLIRVSGRASGEEACNMFFFLGQSLVDTF